MSPRRHSARHATRYASGLAVAVALALASTTGTAMAAEPKSKTPKAKVVKISAKAFPKLLDRPGTSADVLKVTQVAGAAWSVGGTAVTFKDKEKSVLVPVTGEVTVTISPAPASDKGTFLLSGPTSFSYAPTDAPKAYTSQEIQDLLTWIDLPGSKGDSVILPKAEGLVWKIGEVTYDEAKFTKKDALTVKLKAGEKVLPVLVGATSTPAPTEFSRVTDAAQITYKAAQLAAAVRVGDNPWDRTKGFGKDASMETVKITGLPGVQWQVGTATKLASVKPGVVAHVPVSPGDLDKSTTITVTPVPAAGIKVPMTGDKPTPMSVTFDDSEWELEAPDVTVRDVSGTVADTLLLPGLRGMTWFVGQTDAKGKTNYKALKVGKDGTAVYKVKHPKDGKPAAVLYRGVADRGYLLSGGAVKTATFQPTETSVTTPATVSGAVTLRASDVGAASWAVPNTIGGKAVKSTYKPADLIAAGAVSISVPATGTVELKVAKGYKKAGS